MGIGGITLNCRAFKYLGDWSLAGSLFPRSLALTRIPITTHQFVPSLPCPLHGSNAMDAVGNLPLADFLSTSAKREIRAAINLPYQCLPQIAAC